MTNKFIVSIVLAASLALTQARTEQEKHKEFLGFAAKNNKHYPNKAAMDYRYGNWCDTDETIRNHKGGKRGMKLAHNQFSDWSKQEKDGLLGAVP